ncbi:phosphoadenylyl-sulfate reductase [Flavobacterium salilacus subsp. salilacus]|uniref:phosphoadenylyl-sulfate reductase n=1 Tax=Flavobacterium TaxID=237 RepID=UPI0010757AE0|nr:MULTISPECIES: phosphoadenylyl-sulfate reductase [Flavobacterium]KAF2519793.1 phosphoadenylyl-sulfate reductase [Flavobacterium salilacus subsp. salilacus]MBE1614308.1 phosphoadenylyl-sulfate reductase [Flavobacterium sp. SaA2.13]
MEASKLNYYNKAIADMAPAEAITFVLDTIQGKKVFSTSFGIEDQLLTHYIIPYINKVEVFTLDTGRQFNETYDVFQKTLDKYPSLAIKTYYPEETDVQQYVNNYGINGFYESVENRKKCCHIRKVKPLQRAIAGVNLWITGLRAEQSANRESMQFLEWDEANQLIKFNPLLHYTLKEVETEVDLYKIPINSLYKRGYLSIGCAPCTRALAEGEDFRAGRWWWENGKKECGLHIHSNKNY